MDLFNKHHFPFLWSIAICYKINYRRSIITHALTIYEFVYICSD